MEDKIREAMEQIRPSLRADGGDIEIVSIDGTTVNVKLKGACKGCPMSQMTLKQGVERFMKEKVSEDIVVVDVP